ncbi:PilW family protein [Halalkalibacter krulwichiae]|uniref:Prepilin-type N-terminal cleavage/methylation domain-containing protein n=1 Tax=Halalkalibacter krulwichiae TaxID=199441 RepID=A0A1X9MG43_9BACI|nr:prepilin-type N-terminal cleavage/methylation domain-containing protein [Halalkalibacter krulwichiae]ARK31604.1 hypothetical protein BkAM31D_18100 [Halalkalibacter krulwichiae]
MNNQKGVTLVELLVVIALMTVITMVAVSLVSYSLKSEQVVFHKNDTQRQARFLMEYMTREMRDGARWIENKDLGTLELRKNDKTLLIYKEKMTTILLINGSNQVVSESASILVFENEEDANEVRIILEIGDTKLASTIMYSRF